MAKPSLYYMGGGSVSGDPVKPNAQQMYKDSLALFNFSVDEINLRDRGIKPSQAYGEPSRAYERLWDANGRRPEIIGSSGNIGIYKKPTPPPSAPSAAPAPYYPQSINANQVTTNKPTVQISNKVQPYVDNTPKLHAYGSGNKLIFDQQGNPIQAQGPGPLPAHLSGRPENDPLVIKFRSEQVKPYQNGGVISSNMKPQKNSLYSMGGPSKSYADGGPYSTPKEKVEIARQLYKDNPSKVFADALAKAESDYVKSSSGASGAGKFASKSYANGSTVIPNKLSPPQDPQGYGNSFQEEAIGDESADLSLSKMALNPTALSATGGWSAAALPLTLAADTFQWQNKMEASADIKQTNGFRQNQRNTLASPYSQQGGYMQGNFANGGSTTQANSSSPLFLTGNAINGNSLYSMGSKKGDPVKPIYTQDPNDPRLKAYNDSLFYYNGNRGLPEQEGYKKTHTFGMDEYIPRKTHITEDRSSTINGATTKTSKKSTTTDHWQDKFISNYSRERLKPIGEANYIPNNQSSKGILEDYFNPDSIGVPVYKKPVQPVILKKETLSSEQAARKLSPVENKLAPVEATDTQLPDAKFAKNTKYAYMPTNFGQTYYYEMDEQQKKWIPISQQSYNSNTANGTQNTQLYDSKPPGFANGGGVGQRRSYPGWQPYGSNPSLFQMSQNNNNSPGYDDGGPINNQPAPPDPNLRLQPAGQNPAPSGVYPYGFSFIDKKMDVYGGGAGMAGYQNIGNNTALTGSVGLTGVHTPYGGNVAPGANVGITKRFNNGGGVNDDDYGVIPGNGHPKADDRGMKAEDDSFIVPFKNVDIAKGILSIMGYNPEKKMPTMNPADASGNPGSGINISSKEMYLSPEMKNKMQLFTGMDNRMFEQTLSPDSEHNQSFAEGGTPGPWSDKPIGKFADWIYNQRPEAYRDENMAWTQMKDEADELKKLNATDEGSTERELNPPDGIPDDQVPPANPAAPAAPGDDMAGEYNKMNKNMLIANTAAGVGKGIYNMMQKYQDIPKPDQYQPEMYDLNTSAMEEGMNRQVQKAGATARYNARNYAQNSPTNSAINANEIDAKLGIASKVNELQNQQSTRNTDLNNQASLYNLGQSNQWSQQNASNNMQFRQMKGQAVSNNIDQVLKGYQNYGNAKLGIGAMEKGYNIGQEDNALFNKAKTNPGSLTREEFDRIMTTAGGSMTWEQFQETLNNQ